MSATLKLLRAFVAVLLTLMLLMVGQPAGAQTVKVSSIGDVPAVPAAQPPPPPPEDPPEDGAVFVNQNVPSTMVAGSTYLVSITMQNWGNTTWTSGAGYYLAPVNPVGNSTWGITRGILTTQVYPQGRATFSLNVTAPTTPGTYNFQWGVMHGSELITNPAHNVVVTVPPLPEVGVTRSPVPMVAGQPFTLTWNAINATSLSHVCSASGSGYGVNETLPTSGYSSGVAQAGWGGNPSNCTWTATGPGGSRSFNETMVTNPAPPTIQVQRDPSTMMAGSGFTLTWSTSGATSLSHVCSAGGSGYTVSEGLPVNGSTGGTASASWVGYPSTCTWTAYGPGGSAEYRETMTTNPAKPTINVQRNPLTMVADGAYTLTWSTTDATFLSHGCTAAGGGYTVNEGMAVNGSTNGTASASWVGNPSTCTWSATGPSGTTTLTETMTTNPAAPTLTLQRYPSPMLASNYYTLTLQMTGTTSLNRVCTSSGSGFTVNTTIVPDPANATGQPLGYGLEYRDMASPAWVGYPSICTWTATGPGGTATVRETMTTVAAEPRINVIRNPSPMTAGSAYTVNWGTTDATSVRHECTASGSGYSVNETLPASGSASGTASASWIGYPSNCTWTAYGPGGSKTFSETMTTNLAPQPTIQVQRNPNPMTASVAYTLTWSTTDATSVSHVCAASGTGFTINEALALNGSAPGTANPNWVGYPSNCTWTATGLGGSTTVNETMTTNASDVEEVTYIHTDALGSPIARTDASGKFIVSRTNYEPYGLTASGATPTIGFTGHVNDADTGLTYMQQRYYDPVAGRFLSIDPVVTDANTGGSFNRYNYSNNNPFKYIDPDGRSPDNAADRFVIGVMKWIGERPDLVRGLEAAAVAADLGAAGPVAGASAEAARAGGVAAKVAAPTEAQAKNIQRFTSKLPANAKDSVTVRPLPNGGVAAQGISPGKVPGSSALYEKQIDSAGKTIQYTKTTTAPDGTIVHVKDKITGNVVAP